MNPHDNRFAARRAGPLWLWLACTLLIHTTASAGGPALASRVKGRILASSPRATYYVSQHLEDGVIRLNVDWPENDYQTLLVRGFIPHSGKEVRIDLWRKRVTPEYDVHFKLGELPYGTFTARIMVVQRDTFKVAGVASVPFRKLPYRPNEVCLTPDGWALAARRRVLPLVAKVASPSDRLDLLAAAGFDTVMAPGQHIPKNPGGLRIMLALPADVAKATPALTKANPSPVLFGWFAAHSVSPDAFDRFVDAAPYHPLVRMVSAGTLAQAGTADAICIAPSAPAKGKAPDDAAWCKAIAQQTGAGRAVWAALPVTALPRDLRTRAYLALASGARGLVVDLPAGITKAAAWPSIRSVVAEIAALRGVFLDDRPPITVSPAAGPGLRATTIEHQWRTYVFISNTKASATKCRVAVPGLGPGQRLWVVGEKRTVCLDERSALADAFSPLETHVYTTKPQP